MADGPARRRGPPRLLIIDPSVAEAEAEGARTIAAAWPGDTRVVLPVLGPGRGPRPGDGYADDAIVVMGSRSSVLERDAWLEDLAGWLGPVCRGEVERPLLGICFGHQLVAALLGGVVEDARPDGAKIVRYARAEFSGGRLVTGGRSIPVVASHRESVVTAPAGLAATARRDGSPVDAFEHPDRPLFGVQFHPEAREEFAGRAGLAPAGLTDELRRENDALLAAFSRAALAGRLG